MHDRLCRPISATGFEAVGGPSGTMELYRPATVNLTGMHFWIVEPPDPNYPGDDAWLIIDTGKVSALKRTPAVHLPVVPQTAFVNWIYVQQWNAFMYVAAEAADHRWTGPEEDHAGTTDRNIST